MDDAGQVAARMSVSAVARSTGYSVQQIRDLERLGVLGPAHRAENGYRRFTDRHVRDLHTYRDLTQAIGPVAARRTMADARVLPTDQAFAAISGFHQDLHQQRQLALAALQALKAIQTEPTTNDVGVSADADDIMTITQLADALGVRPSTLRFWEHEGLIAPERVQIRSVSARRYPPAAIREARITAALRAAGYRIPDVRRTITTIRDARDTQQPADALQMRLRHIAERTRSLLCAGAALAEIISTRL